MLAKITLTVKNGKLRGNKYEFRDACTCHIGRAADCEILLPQGTEFSTVSRRHCVLNMTPPRIRVRDSGSCNGTRLNGMQIGRPAEWHLPAEIAATPCREYDLTDGDELRVGDTVFKIGISVQRGELPESATPVRAGQELCACV